MRLIYRPIETWPGERTKHRHASPFGAPWSATLDLLDREIGMVVRGRHEAVIQLGLTEADLRQDGAIRANARLYDPGVIVSFDAKDGPLRFQTDRFNDWQSNVRAIALGLEALRKVERYGLGRGTEQYVGFQALPPATPMGAAKMTVDQAITILHNAAPTTVWDYDDPESVHQAWRDAVKTAHPDAGGDAETFRRLTEARDLLTGAGS